MRAPFCPSPDDIPLIPGVNSLVSQEDRDAAGSGPEKSTEEKAEEKAKLYASIEDISDAKGYENFLRDYEGCDPQQKLLVDAIAESGSAGYRLLRASACAGSGKTRCVTLGAAKAYHRHQRREPGGISPQEMVIVTFTVKAAQDLLRKISKYIPKSVVFKMRVGTYHSLPRKSLPPDALPRNEQVRRGFDQEVARNLLGAFVTAAGSHTYLDPAKKEDGGVAVYGQRDIPVVRFTKRETNYDGEVQVTRNLKTQDAFKHSPAKLAKKFASIVGGQLRSRNIRVPEELDALLSSPPDSDSPDYQRYLDVKRYWEELAKEFTKESLTPNGIPLIRQLWLDSRKLKERLRQYDIDDLLIIYYRFLKGPKAEKAATAKLFIVDEAQDNSWLQVNIAIEVAKMSQGTCLLIGDSRQAIYSFRGADPNMFELVTKFPESLLYEISSNYRSGHWIVETGNITATYEDDNGKLQRYSWASGTPAVSMRVTGPAEVSYGGTLGEKFQGQVSLTMVTSKGAPLSLAERAEIERVAEERAEKEAAEEERSGRRKFTSSVSGLGSAKYIAEKIYDGMVRNGHPANHYAIVSRTNAPLALVERALARRGIKAVYSRETPGVLEGKPATRYLMLLALAAGAIRDPEAAKEALMGILKNDDNKYYGGRFRYLSGTNVSKLFRDRWGLHGEPNLIPMLRVALYNNVTSKQGKYEEFLTVADELEELCDAKWQDAPLIAMKTLEEWEKLEMEGEKEGGEQKEEEDEEDRAQSASSEIYGTLKELAEQFTDFKSFMEYIQSARDRAKKRKKPGEEQEEKPKDAVCLTTAHSSKGLEWPEVFVLAYNNWPRKQSGTDEEEEQVRLFYVAATRAENALYMLSETSGTSWIAKRAMLKITALQVRQREEAQRAARLREIEIIEGPSGFEIFKGGRRYVIRADGFAVSSWPTADEAIEAYLTPHEEAPRPMAEQVDTFIVWLKQNAPDVALRVELHPSYRQLVSAIIADDLSTERLGWRRLGDLFPDVPGDALRVRFGDRTIGYLVRSPQMIFHGYMELRAPFDEYTVEAIPREEVNPRYGSLFADDSLALLDARSVYGTLIPEERERPGSTIRLDQPEDRPMLDRPMEQVGETAAEILTAQSVALDDRGDPIIGDVPAPVARVQRIRKLVRVEIPKRRGIEDSATGDFNYLLHIISPGATYVGHFNLSLEPKSGEKVRSYYLLEGSTLTYDTGSTLEIYTVSAGDGFTGTLHPMMTLEVPEGTSSLTMLLAMDLTAFAAQQTDDLVMDFLATPGIGVRDLLLWGFGLGKPLSFEGLPGNMTLKMAHPYGVPPTIKTSQFGRDLKIYKMGDYTHTTMLSEGRTRTVTYSGFNLPALTASGWFSVVSESSTNAVVEWVQDKIRAALPG